MSEHTQHDIWQKTLKQGPHNKNPENGLHKEENYWRKQLPAHQDSLTPEPKHGLTTKDRNFVYNNEGGVPDLQHNGYYPGGSTSGVTVGHGVDLAQHTKAEFKHAVETAKNIPDELRARVQNVLDRIPDVLFAPEHGLKGIHGLGARNYLQPEAHHLHLKQDEGDCLSNIIFNQITDQTQRRYNKTKGDSHAFDDLPENLKTVLTDLSFVMGPGFGQKGDQLRKTLYQDFLDRNACKAADDIEHYFQNIIGKSRAENDVAILRDSTLLNEDSGERKCATPSTSKFSL